MEEIVYSSASRLRSPRHFLRGSGADLRASRELAWRLFTRNLRAQYRQSILGYVWLLLPPIATMLTWVYMNATHLVVIRATRMPYPIFVLTGTMLWQVFTDALNCPLTQLRGARDMLTKVKIPHEALLLAGVSNIIFNFVIRLLVLLLCFGFFRLRLTSGLLLAPAGVLLLIVLGLAAGLVLTPFGLLYQDVARTTDVILGFAFFVTPIVYPPSSVWPASLFNAINPLAPLILTTRNWLALGALPPTPGFVPVALLSFLLLGVGWFFYRLATPHLIARL